MFHGSPSFESVRLEHDKVKMLGRFSFDRGFG